MAKGIESRGSAVVVVGGVQYDKMISLTLKRSMNEAASSGTIVLSWPGAEEFNAMVAATGSVPIWSVLQQMTPEEQLSASGIGTKAFEGEYQRLGQALGTSAFHPTMAKDLVDGADGVILLDGQLADTIMIDKRLSKGTPKSYELTLQFRGAQSPAIDSVPRHETGQENQKSAATIMQALMKGTGVGLEIRGGAASKELLRFITAEGETVERAARRAAREVGAHFYGGKNGQWILQDMGSSNGGGGGELRLGRDFMSWTTNRNISPRFPEIEVMGNKVPDEDQRQYGKKAESLFAQDFRQLTVPGINKLMRVLVNGDLDQDTIKKRAMLEGLRRSGQGLTVTLDMPTWSDQSGKLWDLEDKHQVIIQIDDINESMTISEIEFELTPDTRRAKLTLIADGTFGAGGVSNMLDASRSAQQRELEQQIEAEDAAAMGNTAGTKTPVPPAPPELEDTTIRPFDPPENDPAADAWTPPKPTS